MEVKDEEHKIRTKSLRSEMISLFKFVNESALKKENPIFEVGEEGGRDGRCRNPSGET